MDVLLKPVCHHNAEDVQRKFYGHELTARLVFGYFGGPDGDDGVEDSRLLGQHFLAFSDSNHAML